MLAHFGATPRSAVLKNVTLYVLLMARMQLYTAELLHQSKIQFRSAYG